MAMPYSDGDPAIKPQGLTRVSSSFGPETALPGPNCRKATARPAAPQPRSTSLLIRTTTDPLPDTSPTSTGRSCSKQTEASFEKPGEEKQYDTCEIVQHLVSIPRLFHESSRGFASGSSTSRRPSSGRATERRAVRRSSLHSIRLLFVVCRYRPLRVRLISFDEGSHPRHRTLARRGHPGHESVSRRPVFRQ